MRVILIVIFYMVVNTVAMAEDSPSNSVPKGALPQQPVRIDDIALSDQTLQQNEGAISELIRQEFAATGVGHFAGKRLVELGQRQAVLAALEKNLAIQQSGVLATIARNALLEARAIFDPVLLLSFRYERSERFNRTERDERFRPATQRDEQGRNVLDADDPVDPRDPTAVFTSPQEDRFETTDIAASQASLTGPLETYTYNVAVDQQLPWGARLELVYQAIDEEASFVINPQVFVGNPNPPLDLVRAGSYDRPWISTLLTRLALPVPGSRDFGPYAEQEVAIKLAQLGTESAYWAVQTVINDTLLETELGYWALVNALLDLHVTIENRKSIETLLARTQRLFDLRLVTINDKAQVEAELARLEGEVAQAWNDYVLVSDALTQLLDLDADVVLLPAGYSAMLQQLFPLSQAQRAALSVKDNPQRIGARVDIKAARIEEKTRAVRARPDVSFVGEAEFRQSNRVFGYSSFGDSAKNVVDPDIVTQRYGLDYRYPWGNWAVKAALSQAQANTRKQQLQAQLIENRVQRTFVNARTALASATERARIAARQVELAELTYERAVRQQAILGQTPQQAPQQAPQPDSQQMLQDPQQPLPQDTQPAISSAVRAYEVIVQNVQRLQARRNYIQALTERKQAEARLLAATGELAEVYAQRAAQTELDRYRLELLKETGTLQHFAGEQRP